MFCDWLNVWQQHNPSLGDYHGGRVVSVDGACGLDRRPIVQETGELLEAWVLSDAAKESIDYSVCKFMPVSGSFETALYVRMIAGRVEVRGNPSAYGRLDNLFGVGLDEGIKIYNHVLQSLGLPVFTSGEVIEVQLQNGQTDGQKQATDIVYNGANLTRVDYTENQAVGSGNVQNFNIWLLQQKIYRTAPNDEDLKTFKNWKYDTVYLSTSVFYMGCKSYDKAKALESVTLPNYIKKVKKGIKEGLISQADGSLMIHQATEYLEALALWCSQIGVARLEWSLKNRFLTQNNNYKFWKENETEGFIMELIQLEKSKISSRAVVKQSADYDNLTPAEYKAINEWKKGVNLLDIMPKTTFYRLRTSLKNKVGYDIASRPLVKNSFNDFKPVYFQIRGLSVIDAPSFYLHSDLRLVA